MPSSREFFGRTLSAFSSAALALLSLLVFLTVLSRLGLLSVLGVSVVLTDSMEPSIRPWDLVLYVAAGYAAGDVVVYCPTPSHCYAHRVVGFLSLDTVSGNKTMVITKGDNAEAPDSPVDLAWVRGRVALVVIRELWAPLVLALLAYALRELVRTPVVGYSYALLFSVGLAALVAVYAAVPRPMAPDAVKPPVLNLAGVYFDPLTCCVRIRYTGELSLTGAVARVNSTGAELVLAAERELVLKPRPELLGAAFERGSPLLVEVRASLNHVGRLRGEYPLLVGGLDPEVEVAGGALLIRNPNCFPLTVVVSMRYLGDGGWAWVNGTYVLGGFSQLVVEPPEGARHAYAYVHWLNQGERRWVGLPLRTW